MEHFRTFRLLAEPRAVTEGFVPFQMDRNIIFLYLCTKISLLGFIFLLATGGTPGGGSLNPEVLQNHG